MLARLISGLAGILIGAALAGAVAAVVEARQASGGLLADRHLAAADFPRTLSLADGVFVFSDVHPSGLYVTNDLVVVTSAGVLVADGQKDPATTRKLLAFVASKTSRPITHVVVCSEHGDHTGGHEVFPADAAFIASPVSQAALQAQAARDVAGGPRTVVPSETVADRRVLRLGGTEVQILNLGPAHTGGDLEVYLPAQKILFASEVFSNGLFPQLRAATPTAWVATLSKLAAIDAAWLVPGHGFVDDAAASRQGFAEFSSLLTSLVNDVTRQHAAGATVAAALDHASHGPFGRWPVFDRNGAVAVQRIYDELDGKLK